MTPTFVEHLRALATQRPDDTALIVIDEKAGRAIDTRVSYSALDARTRALAACLQQRFAPGDRVLLLLDNDDHYAVAFLACLYAGLIAVPAFPPESLRPQHLVRLTAIADDAQAACVLATRQLLRLLDGSPIAIVATQAIAVDEIDPDGAASWRPHSPQHDDIAFLQYTSGSTSSPKGVMVSHGNLMANERAIEVGMGVRSDDVFVSWLPLYHDMGLIGGFLQPLHRGIPVGLMTPKFMLERPLRWLEAVSRLHATISGGPDFAFRLCVDRIKPSQLASLDLSCWRLAFSGAEPVRPDTLRDFATHFAAAGFDARALFPCYGLAEATLFVSGSQRGLGPSIARFDAASVTAGRPHAVESGSSESRELVACGAPPPGHALTIVDPISLADMSDSAVGEIWARGDSIAQGYWNLTDASAVTFVERDGLRWLRTGDLGFVHGGRLFVTGRVKDLIILRGHNVYPQDIERAVELGVDAVRSGRVAAFSIDGPDGEGIAIAAEVGRATQRKVSPAALVERLSTVIAEQYGQPPAVVVLLNPGGLPKTSSGKLQRAACRQGWSERTLDAYAACAFGRFVIGASDDVPASTGRLPLNDFERELASIWQDVLPHGPTVSIDAETHFLACGGNSLAAVRLCAIAGARWRVDLPVRLVFEHPRLAAMAREIQCLRKTEAGVISGIPRLPEAQRALALRASPAQERQWFLWRLDPSSTAYHIGGTLKLSGRLDERALATAVDDVFARHESLRTVFRTDGDGIVRQHIDSPRAGQMRRILLDAGPEATREMRATSRAQEVFDRPFDLAVGPLARVALIKITVDLHLLVIAMHHIVGDAASLDVLLSELSQCAAARASGDIAPRPALSVQPADHAAWQRERLAGGEEASQLAWWLGQLGREQPVLALPVERRLEVDATAPAVARSFELPVALAARLRDFSASRNATLFMSLLAAFQALLYRNTGQEDLRVGVPVSQRQHVETATLIGLFVNTQILRATVDGATRFEALLAQVRESTLGAQANAELPFERLVEALQPDRRSEATPLFQVMFNHLREAASTSLRLPGVDSQRHPLRTGAAQCELTLDTIEHADGRLSATFSHAPGRFAARTIARFEEQFAALLQALVERPGEAVGDTALLAATDLAQLRAWSHNPRRFADATPVHRAIERQAYLRPDAIALTLDDRAITYAQLESESNRLAHRLVTLGTHPDDRIGLAIERSFDLAIALLAILKAGAAYVPLDPQYPSDRLALMVDDSGIGLILTRHAAVATFAQLAASAGIPLLAVDRLDLDREPATPPALAVHGDNLAYLIYTSGSTGRPKGVGIAHRMLAEHTRIASELFNLTPADRVLQFSTPNFDGFVEQLFPALCAGATVVLRGTELWDANRFHREVHRHRITVADLTTAYWLLLAQDAALHAAKAGREAGTLRLVHAGGEAMPLEGLRAWQSSGLARVSLRNTYGPTEACVTATALDCDAAVAEAGTSVLPLGGPLAARSLHVVDADMNLVAPGVAGELCIGGPLLARGYLGQAALTAQRFVADPFSKTGARLYRTGDLVRWDVDGRLDYLGRIDHQVKIRGFRVELGDIEAQLLAQPEVGAAVVVARPALGTMSLAAYVAPRPGAHGSLLPSLLRERLSQALPDYMVPAAIVVLDSLPLNANGKIDRQALPPPAAVDEPSTPYEPPQGPAELALASLWSEVLRAERIGRHDNFFERGGHSLAAIRIAALWSQRVGGELPIRAFFDAPTLAGIAAQAAGAISAGTHDDTRHRLAAMDELLDEFES